jgi:lysophospholipase L1-like esterase
MDTPFFILNKTTIFLIISKTGNYMRYFLLQLLILLPLHAHSQIILKEKNIRFLALGDSYTIGESVKPENRWPEQFSDSLDMLGLKVQESFIRAVTGWTTADLLHSLKTNPPQIKPNLISLMIGVNNQYQEQSIQNYEKEFEELLEIAVEYADGNKDIIFVVSIPDYAYTPFGEGNKQISKQIRAFNEVNQRITNHYGISYINVTGISRKGLTDLNLVASDGLHPSGKQYTLWVGNILEKIRLEPGLVEFSP